MQNFENKIAVITGAASGIGLALAKTFAQQGMNIVMADIEAGKLDTAQKEVAQLGVATLAIACDVSNPQSVENLATSAVDHFGAIHIACNNAGVFDGGYLWEATLDDYEWLIGVNQYGVINGIRSFIPRMIATGEPCHMLNTASMAAVTAMPFSGIYNMTKHAVLALSETLYHELSLVAPQVGVSCLCPELVNTDIARSMRNRPEQLEDAPSSESRSVARDSIVSSTAGGVDPTLLAERSLRAIRDEQFYILAEDAWRDTANARLEDIRTATNPRLIPPDL